MTIAQVRLRRKWIITGTALFLVLVLSDFIEANAGWLRWVILASILIVQFRDGRPRSETLREGKSNLASLVESAPSLKAWFVFCAALALFGVYYTTHHSVDLVDIFSLRFIVLSFAVLIGPPIILMERNRYKELGEESDAI